MPTREIARLLLSRVPTDGPHMTESRGGDCGIWRKRAELVVDFGDWTSERIAAAFGVRPDSVRHWRWIFGREGIAGLRVHKAAGPAAAKAQAALSVIEQVLAPDVAERANWTLPRLQDEIERRTGERISKTNSRRSC